MVLLRVCGVDDYGIVIVLMGLKCCKSVVIVGDSVDVL